MTEFAPAALRELALLLRTAARTEIMPRWRQLDSGDVQQKTGPLDLVTVADVAAERMIAAGLKHRFPGCVVVGEEGASEDPALLDQLADADLAFVVDPIDGTANFAAGLPLFGVMAAALMRGKIVAAAIHDPVGDDTALALLDQGAWMETPDGKRRPLRVADPVPPSQMSGAAAWRHLSEPVRGIVCAHLPRVAASFDLRCAAHQYRLAAAGHCHFLLYNRMLPWDHAPGWLLHREAGGHAARFDGSPYSATETNGGLLAAPDAASWRSLHASLFEA